MKKKRLMLIILGLGLFLVACGQGSGPEARLGEFIQAMKDFDYPRMGSYILEENRGEMKDLDFQDQVQNIFMDYVRENARKIDYEILESKLEEEEANFRLAFTYVDGRELLLKTFSRYMEESLGLALAEGDLDDERLDQLLASILEEEAGQLEETYAREEVDIRMLRRDGDWYLEDFQYELLNIVLSNYLNVFAELENLG